MYLSFLSSPVRFSVINKDAYIRVPAHQWFQCFAVGPLHYQFAGLSFGLLCAPRMFTKMLSIIGHANLLWHPHCVIFGPIPGEGTVSLDIVAQCIFYCLDITVVRIDAKHSEIAEASSSFERSESSPGLRPDFTLHWRYLRISPVLDIRNLNCPV